MVVVHFGNGDLAAYDFDGKQLWHRNLQKDYGDYTIWWGHANSPVLYEDLVISICIQDSCADLPGKPSPSYVVAHDMRTGQEAMEDDAHDRAPRAKSCDSYTTPLLVAATATGGVGRHGRADARRLRPGHRQAALVSARVDRQPHDHRPGGRRGDDLRHAGNAEAAVGRSAGRRRANAPRQDVVWQFDQGTPDSPTPVVWGESLFLVTNDGIARCLDAATGRLQWKERLKGEYRASPLAADGRIYFLNTKGLTTVVAASPRFEPPGREPARRRDLRLAGRLRRPHFHPRTQGAILCGKIGYNGVFPRSLLMRRLKSIWRKGASALAVLACWLAIYGTALAQRSVPVEESTKGDATSWLLPYAVVLLFVGLGVFVVCRPTRRRERARPEEYQSVIKDGTLEERLAPAIGGPLARWERVRVRASGDAAPARGERRHVTHNATDSANRRSTSRPGPVAGPACRRGRGRGPPAKDTTGWPAPAPAGRAPSASPRPGRCPGP